VGFPLRLDLTTTDAVPGSAVLRRPHPGEEVVLDKQRQLSDIQESSKAGRLSYSPNPWPPEAETRTRWASRKENKQSRKGRLTDVPTARRASKETFPGEPEG